MGQKTHCCRESDINKNNFAGVVSQVHKMTLKGIKATLKSGMVVRETVLDHNLCKANY